jgi:beta-lactamase regulating signal transducer with metallopeptidase domain
MDPVVAETLVISGAGAATEFTDTLSNVAVVRAVVLPLFTARPTSTLWAMVIVWLVPSCTQFSPSEETKLLNVFPLLLTFSQ